MQMTNLAVRSTEFANVDLVTDVTHLSADSNNPREDVTQKTGRADSLGAYSPVSAAKQWRRFQPVIQLLRQIGERYSKTPSQVALRWLIENPLVLPIAGAKNGKQASENAGALSFSLTPDEVEILNEATLAWRL